MLRKLLALCMLFVCLVSGAMAHGGKTDSKGGHTDRSTGQYHYHHGYSAHQHINGVCPYDVDDKTGESSGSPSSGYSVRTTPRPTATPKPATKEEVIVPIPVAVIAGIILFCIMTVYSNNKQDEIRREVRSRDNTIRKLEKELEQQKTLVEECNGKVKETIRSYEAIVVEYKVKLEKKVEKEEAVIDEPVDLHAAYETARTYGALGEFYLHHTLREMANIPKGYTIGDDGLPREVNTLSVTTHRSFTKKYWGETFTRFVSSTATATYHPTSLVYHRSRCQHAYYTMNVADLKYARPCGSCKPDELPDLEWYERYKEYKGECDKLGIQARLE